MATETNQSDQPQPCSPAAKKLLKLAAEAQELIDRISNESEVYRISGRMVRLAQFPLDELTEEELAVLVIGQSTLSPLLLQPAIAQISYELWTEMWNDRFSFHEPSDEQNSELTSLWCEKVLGMLKKCGQDVVLSFDREEYASGLIRAGASEEEANRLANGLSAILSGGTTPPS